MNDVPIGQRIDRQYATLSPQEQRAADIVLDRLDDLAIFSAAEIAQLSGVSKATVSRLVRRLGYDDFAQVRAQARALRGLGSPMGGAVPTVILDAPAGELRELLRSCLAVPRWIEQVAAGAPYARAADLLDRARQAADPLRDAEVELALADHPRIGERPLGTGRSAAFSRDEQHTTDTGDPELAAAVAAGNAAYEARFGRVFLIRAAGRSRAEIHAEQERRLALDDAADLRIVAGELREIALLRLRRLLAEERPAARSHITTHVLDAVRGIPASHVDVTLEQCADATWTVIGEGRTGADGRIAVLGPAALPAGRYRVTFDTGSYFARLDTTTFYPQVVVVVELADPAAHYHVPLLLSPFGYSTYRGS